MKRPLRLLLILTVLSLASAACLSSAVNRNAGPGEVIFQDDFENRSGDWTDAEDEDGATVYADGAYQIRIATPSYYLWSNPEVVPDLTDVQVEVDVTKAGGPDMNDMGVICRYVDENNFYFLTITADGYYGIGKLKEAEDSLIGTDELLFNDEVIQTGSATNHVRADCIGTTLVLYANGVELLRVEDGDFAEGGVGVIAGSYEQGSVDVRFDNFRVFRP